MANLYRLNKLALRWGLLVALVVSCNPGYGNSLATNPIPLPSFIAQPARTPTSPASDVPSTPRLEKSNRTTEQPSLSIIWEMIAQVNRDRVLTDLRKLTGEEPICIGGDCYTIAHRLTGSEGLQWAKDYIYGELTNLGYSVQVQDWARSGYADQNLIARKPGTSSPDEVIYFVAHVDGVKTDESAQFPAADDNASGVIDNIELARILSGYSLNRTVVLLFSTGEEQGTLGVLSYISQLSPAELSSIFYVVDVDMIGYDANADSVMELWHGGDSASMALTQIISDTIGAYQLNLVPRFAVGCG